MDETNDTWTIVSMAVIASGAATLLHEGLGHGVVAWARGDVVTELTSNHLSAMRADHWVEAGGTIVNLIAGVICLLLARQKQRGAHTRYFLWLLGALNLLPGAGYFLYSGIFDVGDWSAILRDLPHKLAWRIGITLVGAAAYIVSVRVLAITIRPFVREERTYNAIGRLPYLAAGVFSCIAGALDPLGMRLFVVATVAAAFGGSSGLLWADSLMPAAGGEPALVVHRQRAWWVLAIVFGGAYVVFLGRGIAFAR